MKHLILIFFPQKELKLRDPDKLNILVIAGNKCDLKEKRQVAFKDGKTFADEYDAIFLETSAKTGQCINELFHMIGKIIEFYLNLFDV